jgi:hypothetical protein
MMACRVITLAGCRPADFARFVTNELAELSGVIGIGVDMIGGVTCSIASHCAPKFGGATLPASRSTSGGSNPPELVAARWRLSLLIMVVMGHRSLLAIAPRNGNSPPPSRDPIVGHGGFEPAAGYSSPPKRFLLSRRAATRGRENRCV